MCGIIGIVGHRNEEALRKGLDAIQHRGPDDVGSYSDPETGVSLGHRRLSIIDLSSAAHQPMCSPDRGLWIVYNGEVYNFRELRKELQQRGRTFSTQSDTEVVLAAYDEWHEEMPRHLRGMFAFAIWDVRRKELFLARDRLGIKPLYYSFVDGVFVFGSEVQALLATGRVSRDVDRQSIWDYLSYGSVIQPRTILNDVKALEPGHSILFRDSSLALRQYWDIEEATRTTRRENANLPYSDAIAMVRTRLEEATRLHLISDVPVGAFLSGGIDSTAVVGLMSQIAHAPIKTFTLGFETGSGQPDELLWAREASQRFNTDHHEVIITKDAVGNAFDRFIDSMDQPSGDGLNSYLVSEATRTSVTVVLSGLGGDELFAGYPHFVWNGRASKLRSGRARRIRRVLEGCIRITPSRWKGLLSAVAMEETEYLRSLRLASSEEQKRLITRKVLRNGYSFERSDCRPSGFTIHPLDPISRVSYFELKTYLRDTLLRDADVLSMAHSLELRPVLLDHVLAEFVFSLPGPYKCKGGDKKRVLVDALADMLPASILRRKKMGFELPLAYWLRNVLRSQAEAAFRGPRAEILFSTGHLQKCLGEIASGTSSGPQLWNQFILLEFLRRYGLEIPT